MECKTKSYTSNNGCKQNHLKIIQIISEQLTFKAQHQGTTENSHSGHFANTSISRNVKAQSFDLYSTLISKDWSPLVYSHAVSLFSFHLSETSLRPFVRPSVHPSVFSDCEWRSKPVVIFYIFVFPYRVLCTPPALHHNIIERLDPMWDCNH